MTFASCVIDELKTGTYTVTRITAETKVLGRRVAGTPSTFPIDAIITPITGHVLLTLLEGIEWATAVKSVITTTALLVRTSTQQPDQVTIKGELWEVFQSADWEPVFSGDEQGDHHECLVARRVIP